jgi:antitoxin component of RelBE/YafQ-DinJ toxin-antitoxin module
MSMKTFNVDEEVYSEFSSFCKEHGINMSKQVETFMKWVVAEEPKAKKEYLKKLDRIRKENFLQVDDFASRYGL